MATLVTALWAAGAQLTDVVKTTIYVASSQQTDLDTAWHVVRAAFGEHDAPGTLLSVSVRGHLKRVVPRYFRCGVDPNRPELPRLVRSGGLHAHGSTASNSFEPESRAVCGA